jgi:hypothetical protein
MPIQVPVLDDRTFADLVSEARTLISTFDPTWTNHNLSDPGMTLVDLFAHLTEVQIYRLDRVTRANLASFLSLLDGKPRAARDLPGLDLPAEIRTTILGLRKLDRAVSRRDFETLALEADPLKRIERVRAVPRRNLFIDVDRERPGHMSIIVLPTVAAEPQLQELKALVAAYLEPRLLLTTRAHVLGPFHVPVHVTATVVPLADQLTADVQRSVVNAVTAFLDPHTGGDDGKGWPFGRNVFVSELFALIDRLPEVDFVTSLSLTASPSDRVRVLPNGKLIGIEIKPHELVRADIIPADVTVGS